MRASRSAGFDATKSSSGSHAGHEVPEKRCPTSNEIQMSHAPRGESRGVRATILVCGGDPPRARSAVVAGPLHVRGTHPGTTIRQACSLNLRYEGRNRSCESSGLASFCVSHSSRRRAPKSTGARSSAMGALDRVCASIPPSCGASLGDSLGKMPARACRHGSTAKDSHIQRDA